MMMVGVLGGACADGAFIVQGEREMLSASPSPACLFLACPCPPDEMLV